MNAFRINRLEGGLKPAVSFVKTLSDQKKP